MKNVAEHSEGESEPEKAGKRTRADFRSTQA